MQENIINLIDENGVESQFEIILTLEAEGKEYAILMPVEEEEAEEALVFRIDQDERLFKLNFGKSFFMRKFIIFREKYLKID